MLTRSTVTMLAFVVVACGTATVDDSAPGPTDLAASSSALGEQSVSSTVAVEMPATPFTTTSSSTTTTSVSATTTATTDPPRSEDWHVPGRVYYFPIQPPDVTSYSASHHDYPATDIFGPEGSTVVAVTSGVIDELSRTDRWDRAVDDPATRGGLYVSLIGDDGIRYYYSHLLAIAAGLDVGDRVAAGQVIGLLGRTGNAAGTSPHVHFGISPPTFPGDWEVRRGVFPPYEYLRAWEAGVDAVPDLP